MVLRQNGFDSNIGVRTSTGGCTITKAELYREFYVDRNGLLLHVHEIRSFVASSLVLSSYTVYQTIST